MLESACGHASNRVSLGDTRTARTSQNARSVSPLVPCATKTRHGALKLQQLALEPEIAQRRQHGHGNEALRRARTHKACELLCQHSAQVQVYAEGAHRWYKHTPQWC